MIKKYIEASRNMKPLASGSNKECYVFDEVVLLKSPYYLNDDDSIRVSKLDALKNNGVNVCRVIERIILNNTEYELQEKAKGEELFNFRLYTTPAGQQKYLEILDSLSKQDIPFYEKFLEDWNMILQMGFTIDPSKCTNFFYDGSNIVFIDLNLTDDDENSNRNMLIRAGVVLRGGGLLWKCKDVYNEANERIKIIYQKLGKAALKFGVDIDNFVLYFDPDGEYDLRNSIETYNK